MLTKYLKKLFAIGDSNQDGVLQPIEFLELLQASGLDFPAEIVLKLFVEADANGDGVIEYDEFVPAMTAIIAAKAKAKVSPTHSKSWIPPDRHVLREQVDVPAAPVDISDISMPNPADVPADMMADYLQKLFKVADSNDDGVLSPIEFAELLRRSGFKLPDHMIIQMIKAADVNEGGVIEYENLVPAMMGLAAAMNEEVLVPHAGEGVSMWNEVPPDMLERYLEELFQIGDTNGDGVLQPKEFLELLTHAGLRFPAKLVLKLFSEAGTNGDCEENDFDIFVKLPPLCKGVCPRKSIGLKVNALSSIDAIKAKIQAKVGPIPDQLCIFFAEEPLKKGCTLQDYNIQKFSTLQLDLVRGLKGGMMRRYDSDERKVLRVAAAASTSEYPLTAL